MILAISGPSDAHLAQVEVALVKLRALPPLCGFMIAKLSLSTLASTFKSFFWVSPIAEPLRLIFFCVQILGLRFPLGLCQLWSLKLHEFMLMYDFD